MASFNSISTFGATGNIGQPAGKVHQPGMPKGLLFVPKGTAFDMETVDGDFFETLQDGCLNGNRALRYFPLEVISFESQGEDRVTESVNGNIFETAKATYAFLFRVSPARGMNGHINMINLFDKRASEYDVFIWDEYNTLMGTTVRDSATQTNMLQGYSIGDISVSNRGMKTRETESIYNIFIAMKDARQHNENYGFAEFTEEEGNLNDLKGLIPINLDIQEWDNANATLTFKATSGFGGTNMTQLTGATLGAIGAMRAVTGSGAVITITAASRAGDYYTATLDDADPDYPAAGGFIYFSFDNAAIQGTPYNITGYESNVIRIKVG